MVPLSIPVPGQSYQSPCSTWYLGCLLCLIWTWVWARNSCLPQEAFPNKFELFRIRITFIIWSSSICMGQHKNSWSRQLPKWIPALCALRTLLALKVSFDSAEVLNKLLQSRSMWQCENAQHQTRRYLRNLIVLQKCCVFSVANSGFSYLWPEGQHSSSIR